MFITILSQFSYSVRNEKRMRFLSVHTYMFIQQRRIKLLVSMRILPLIRNHPYRISVCSCTHTGVRRLLINMAGKNMYMLLFGNNALEQNTGYSSLKYYVHVLLSNATKQMFTFQRFANVYNYAIISIYFNFLHAVFYTFQRKYISNYYFRFCFLL
jgi:hypothetical protein